MRLKKTQIMLLLPLSRRIYRLLLNVTLQKESFRYAEPEVFGLKFF